MRYRFDQYELDEESRLLLRGHRPVDVGQLTFDLIRYLALNRHRVVTKTELRERVWGGKVLRPSTIPTAVNAARTALSDSAKRPRIIQTVYGHGYRLIVPVNVAETDPSASDPSSTAPRIFGREAELAELEVLLDPASGNRTRLVLVSGEPGIGKTRLLDEFYRAAAARHCQLAVGFCSEVQGAPPFWPWRRILDEAGGGGLWPSLGRLSGRNLESEEGAGAARFELFDQVARVLARTDGERLIIAIDDLHCADIPSLRLLEFIAAQSRPLGVHIVGAHRLPIDKVRQEALQRLAIASRAQNIRLRGISDTDAKSLVEVRAKFPARREIMLSIVNRGQGNPLFLRQIVEQLNSAFVRSGPQHLLEEALRVGPGLRWVVEARLAELDEDVLELLRACAVIGREFDAAMASSALNEREERVLALLEEPLRLEVVEERNVGGRFRFTHVLYQEVLYEGTRPGRRTALHRAVLEALERSHGELTGDLACTAARHCLALPVGVEPERSVNLLREAARWSEVNLGFEEEVSYLEGALRVLERAGVGSPKVRGEVLVQLSGALRRSGDRAGAAAACRGATALARASGSAEDYCRAALAYSPGFFALEAGVLDDYLIETLEEARSLAVGCSVDLRSRIAGRLAMALYWSEDETSRSRYGEEAVELARSAEDSATRVNAAIAREVSRWGPSGASDRAALASWAIEHANAAGDREMELVCRLYRTTSLLQLGRFDESWSEIELFSRKAATSLHGGALWYRELFGALKAMIFGEWERAEALAQEMRRLGERVQDRNSENCAVIHEAYREMEYGSDARALSLVDQQGRRFPRVRSYQCGRALLSATTGDYRTARRLLRSAVNEVSFTLPRTIEWMISAALLAETCVSVRDKSRAQVIFKELSEYENEFVVVVFSVAVWRPVSYFLARLATLIGRYDEAERLFQKAQQQSLALGANSWLSHIEFGHAEMLRKRAWPGDGRRARDLALAAEDRAQQLTMRPLLGRIRSFLWGEKPEGVAGWRGA